MKTSHTFGIQFITRTNKYEKSIGKVYARITVDKKRVELSLKKSIDLNDWNKGKGCAKGSNPEAKLLNTYFETRFRGIPLAVFHGIFHGTTPASKRSIIRLVTI